MTGQAVDLAEIQSDTSGTAGMRVTDWFTAGRLAGMVFVADDLAAWLTGVLADAGRRRLITFVRGTDQERALRRAATAAVELTVGELRPDDRDRASGMALVISQVFGKPLPAVPLAAHATILQALQAGIAGQLAVLDDVSLTGTGQSSADVLGLPASQLAERLTAYLVREIVSRGAEGSPLFPLASQLNDDLTHLQGLRVEGKVDQLGGKLAEVLDRLDDLRPPRTARVAPAQLPPLTRGFAGREAYLAVLAGLLDPAVTTAAVAVSGLAGVGKTTLVVAAGHVARDRGWFPGGALFVDLHGYDERPVEPGAALDSLLRALGLAAEDLPPTVEERAGLYRSALAQTAEPMLVIADNASSEAQVRPLLPGAGPHKVLVTSRQNLTGLDARLIDITTLSDEEAIEVLDAALRIARPEDNRIGEDFGAATRIARVCSGLPLALRIVAALLKDDPTFSTIELADELAAGESRLERLTYDDGNELGPTSVAAAFELSYRRLEPSSAKVFRLLSAVPGPDISNAAAAALTDLPIPAARRILASLASAHLVESAKEAGRWQMHDLVRFYTIQKSDLNARADDREQARERVLGYYLRMAGAANERLSVTLTTPGSGEFSGYAEALDWLDAERVNLIAAIDLAAESGRHEVAISLPLAIANYLGPWRGRTDELIAVATISLDISRQVNDKDGEAKAATIIENAVASARNLRANYGESGESPDRHGIARYLAMWDPTLAGLIASRRGVAAATTAFHEHLDGVENALIWSALARALKHLRYRELTLDDASKFGHIDKAVIARATDAINGLVHIPEALWRVMPWGYSLSDFVAAGQGDPDAAIASRDELSTFVVRNPGAAALCATIEHIIDHSYDPALARSLTNPVDQAVLTTVLHHIVT